MLHFERPNFKSGVMVMKAVVAGNEYGWILRPAQKGTDVDFAIEGVDTGAIETALLAKYPGFLTVPV